MIRFGTLEAAKSDRTRYEVGPLVYWKTQLIVTPERGIPSPNGYLVEQEAGCTVRPHFHYNQQFQVIVNGDGTLGRHEVCPLVVHYAKPQTPYGPIVAGPNGLWYFTLRPITETGAWFMPESVDMLEKSLQRGQATSEPLHSFEDGVLRDLKAPTCEEVIQPEENGLAAWLMRLPPSAKGDVPPEDFANGGRYYLVKKGSLRVDGQDLPQHSLVWVSDEDNYALQAGSQGAEVLALQYPTFQSVYKENPILQGAARPQ